MAFRIDLPDFINHMGRFVSKVKQHVKAYFTIQLGALIKLQWQKKEGKWKCLVHCITPPILKK
ncbi:LOW QUALITY PROTEIN: hypothetical protein PHPALM_13916 [Phytophthora palmivora]|uniref:Uncharacterized protein n=1 Tax=Phytophthora palmivora TaxID=4796 RepID=A0A2P4XW40_9STRA|nr:LOW QUALITY PROTEIN: hypothetical protein PHPALM_13916 [Phytophthora palmivora]